MAAPAVQPVQKKIPFRYGTRQRVQLVGLFPVTEGNSLSVELPRVGFLSGIIVQLYGGLIRTAGDTGAFAWSMANLLKRLQVNMNIGAAAIVDISGNGCKTFNETLKMNYGGTMGGQAPFPPVPGALTNQLHNDTLVFEGDATVPNASFPAANEFLMSYYLPIGANSGRNFNMGLLNLQAPQVRCTVDLKMGTKTDVFVDGATLTGTSLTGLTIAIHYIYYEVPNPSRVDLPPLALHRLLEERTPFASFGDLIYTVPQMGTLLRLLHIITTNGLQQYNVTDFRLRVNKTDDVYRYGSTSPSANRFLQRFNYGHTMPEAVLIHEFWNAEEVPASGDFRDAINTESISTLESIITIGNLIPLGVGNNFVDSLREIVQVLQV